MQSGSSFLLDAPEDIEDFNLYFQERGWGDGLPLVPPTPARVEKAVACSGRAAADSIAVLAPAFGEATVERIAVNAVMAGCRPEYMPVLIAAVQAASSAEFSLQSIQVTTNPVAVWLIVNGPAAKQLGLNCGINCLGPGTWANATLGRALSLILKNIGGAYPGDMDRATHGQPGKYTFCCSEVEDAELGWPPLHVERDFPLDASTVTVVGAAGTLNMNCHSKNAQELLRVIADTLMHPTSNDYVFRGAPWLIFGPDSAAILQRAGFSKADVKTYLWNASRMQACRLADSDLEMARSARQADLGTITQETAIPISRHPDDIGILVAGGPGTHTVYVPSIGVSAAVTRRIEWGPASAPNLHP